MFYWFAVDPVVALAATIVGATACVDADALWLVGWWLGVGCVGGAAGVVAL